MRRFRNKFLSYIFIALNLLSFSMLGTSALAKKPRLRALKGYLNSSYAEHSKSSTLEQFLVSNDGEVFKLKTQKNIPIKNQEIKIKGYLKNGLLKVKTFSYDNGSKLRFAKKPIDTKILGEEKVLVALIKDPNDSLGTNTISKEEIEERFFGDNPDSLKNFFKDSSYGKVNINGDVVDWTNIPNLCKGAQNDFRSYYKITKRALKHLSNKTSVNQYSRFIFITPDDSNQVYNCFKGDLKGYGSIGKTKIKLGKRKKELSFSFLPSNSTKSHFLEHELGHNFGALHANSLYCGNENISTSQNCKKYEYGDVHDLMGNQNMQEFNAVRKEQFGWFKDGELISIHENESRSINLKAIDSKSSGAKAIKIPAKHGTYYIEFLKKVEKQSDANFKKFGGALIRYVSSREARKETLLIDATPGSINSPNSDFYDSALREGKTYKDSRNNLEISTIEVNPDEIKLKILR